MISAPVTTDATTDVAVSIDHVRKVYQGRNSHEALSDIELSVRHGEMLVLLGPSGCGKTTLLRAVAGLEDISSGAISLNGHVVSDPARHVNEPPNKRDVGFVFQNYALWPHMKVRANVAYPLRSRKVKRQPADVEAVTMLESLGCETLVDRYPGELSGGQQQRVALARGLIGGPRAVLLDEPLSNVDAQLRHELRSEIRRLHAKHGFTGIYVTHDQHEAIEIADRIAVLRDGKVAQIDVPESIYRAPADAHVARFLGVDNVLTCRRAGPREIVCEAGRLEGRIDRLALEADSFDLFVRRQLLRVASADALTGDSSYHERRCVLTGGVVADVVFTGEATEIVVRFGDLRLSATLDSEAEVPSIGDRVGCHFRPEQALLYRRDVSVSANESDVR